MKHKLSILALALAAAFSAAADTWTDENTGYTWSYTLANGEATVTGVEPKSGTDLTIPDTLGDCPVTVIDASAFKDNAGFKGTLTLPNSLKQVKSYSFGGCTGLTQVEMSSTVTNIGDSAFCGCKYLVNIRLSEGLLFIGESAFKGCSALTRIQLPDSVQWIGNAAFSECANLTGKLCIPGGVSELNENLFSGCKLLTEIILPNGLQKIKQGVFANCRSLVQLTIPDAVHDINAKKLFSNCFILETVRFPKMVDRFEVGTGIADCTFLYCYKLKYVEFPEGIETADGIIYDTTLKEYKDTVFVFPKSLKKIGSWAFGYSDFTGRLIFKGDLPTGYEYIPSTATVICPRSWGAKAQSVGVTQNFAGYYQTNAPIVTIVSSGIRAGDPTIMDVKYKVASSKSTVKVRALAFKDGTRSLANIVVPKSFVEDVNGNATAGNVGDSVTANEEHTLSWKVSEDWQETLANVSFEVLAVEDDILPLELTTIPGTTEHPATIQVSWNYITGDRVFDALLWLYADGDLGITLSNGQLKHGDTTIASGTGNTGYDALVYVYSKMGYSLLQGDELTYAKNALRLDLPDVSTRQYAYKVISEK